MSDSKNKYIFVKYNQWDSLKNYSENFSKCIPIYLEVGSRVIIEILSR